MLRPETYAVTPCTVCAVRGGPHEPFEVHPKAGELLESVVFMLRHGDSPAQVIATLLNVYGEDPPAQIGTLLPAEARVLLTVDNHVTSEQASKAADRIRERFGDDVRVCVVQANGAVMIP